MNQIIQDEYEKNYSHFIGYIRKRLSSAIDYYSEEDILQDVFYSIIDGVDISRPIDNIVGYIYSSIRNRIIDLLRKKKVPVINSSDHYVNNMIESIASDSADNPEISYEADETVEFIYEALATLSQEQKEIFILTELEGLTFREVSEKTGISINTLLSRKRYAVKKLRELLSENA